MSLFRSNKERILLYMLFNYHECKIIKKMITKVWKRQEYYSRPE